MRKFLIAINRYSKLGFEAHHPNGLKVRALAEGILPVSALVGILGLIARCLGLL
jgi:hypothetical protein